MARKIYRNLAVMPSTTDANELGNADVETGDAEQPASPSRQEGLGSPSVGGDDSIIVERQDGDV